MGIIVDVIRTAVNTSTGNQTFTGDIGGLTPKAARFIMVKATTDGTAAVDRYISVGFTDGTRERCVGYSENDNTASMESQGWYRTDKCVEFVNESATVIASATFVSFGSDAVTINWTTAPGSAWLLTVELYGGSDLSVYVDHVDVANTVDLTTDNTDPGFEPDILHVMAMTNIFNPGVTANAVPSYGMVHNDGASTITQRAVTYYVRDGRASEDTKGYVRNDAGVVQISTTALDWYGEFGTFDSSGFSITTRNNGGNSVEVCYLALSFGGAVDSGVITYNTPTSTGDDPDTGLGFTPQFMATLNHQIGTFNNHTGSAPVGTFGISSIVSDTEYSSSAQSEDGAPTINAQSLTDNVALELPNDDGTADVTGTLSSFDANGFTINYTAVGGSAYPFFVLAIEEEVSGAFTINVSESVTVGESVTVTLPDALTASVTDAITTGEAVTTRLESYVDVSESVTVGEVVAVALGIDISVTESVTVGESVLVALVDLAVDVSEPVTVGEAVTVEATRAISVTESVTVAEDVTVALPDALTADVSDAVTVGEETAITLQIGVSVTESVTIGEAVTVTLPDALALSVSDDVTIAEAVTVEAIRTVSVSESVTVGESSSVILPDALAINVTESVTVGESVNVSVAVAGVFSISVSDTVTVGEAVTLAMADSEVDVADAVTIGESVTARLESYVNVSESVTIGESVTVSVSAEGVLAIDVSESVTVGEVVTVAPLLLPGISASEAVTVGENVTVSPPEAASLAVSVTDALTIGESVEIAPLLLPGISVSESVTVTDSVLLTVGIVAIIAAFGTIYSPGNAGTVFSPRNEGEIESPDATGTIKSDRYG